MKATKLTALLMAAVMMGGTACEFNKKGVPPARSRAGIFSLRHG